MMRIPAPLLLALSLAAGAWGTQEQTYTTADFATWSYPKGLVEVRPGGTQVKHFGRTYNAMSDVGQYSASLIGEHGTSPVRTPSGTRTVGRLADQNPDTWWQPDLADPIEKWWVEVDLGRAVAADKIRLIFPDTTGARPFEFFSVFTSPGVPLKASPEQVYFTRVGRPINNNTARVVEFPLNTVDPAGATGQYMVTGDTLHFDLVRFVRFEATGHTVDAALAEIEVETIGFNLALKVNTDGRVEQGAEVWGGRSWTSSERKCAGCGKGTGAEGLVDGDISGRYWAIEAAANPEWRTWGQWGGVDLGNVFRIDRIVWLPLVGGETPYLYGHDRERQTAWGYFDFLTSNGTFSNSADAEVEGPYEYEMLSSVENIATAKRWLFDFQFPTRETRYVFWRLMPGGGNGSWGRAAQLLIYHSEGYPAQVELESPDLDLGNAYSIRHLQWEADTPPDTRIEIETQTGNGFQKVTRYYLTNGQEVTKEQYDAAKARQRGDIVDALVRDPTWSDWSPPHRFSGQDFLSPTPRQWLRVRVKLISDDPEAMPSLRSLTFIMNTPVVGNGLSGEILPREAVLDSLQEFRYLIKPNRAARADLGYDQVLIALPPGSSEAKLVSARVQGREVAAQGQLRGDSLLVILPPPAVKTDSVEVRFQTRVFENPTVFEAFVSNSSQADNTQGVVPAALGSDQVFVPEVSQAASFFQNLNASPVCTPNGDGANDLFHLSFNVVKTARQPSVRIHRLDGAVVAELANATPAAGRASYTWDGQGPEGQTVPPGLYLARIHLETDAGDETLYRLVHVVY
ncbi:MAG: hypothetical protein IT369_17305 [Candidatus Latescibacteria bacterium]|nr:hypothetical protein [Candidatus Latescibacterota bacterium]